MNSLKISIYFHECRYVWPQMRVSIYSNSNSISRRLAAGNPLEVAKANFIRLAERRLNRPHICSRQYCENPSNTTAQIIRARRGRGNASRQVSKDLCLAPSNLGRNRVWLVRDILVSPLSVKSLTSTRRLKIQNVGRRVPPRFATACRHWSTPCVWAGGRARPVSRGFAH